MMMCKHALGPKRMITPPATPPRAFPPLPFMAREPFPAEMITSAKLDAILDYVKHGNVRAGSRRVEHLESEVVKLSTELRDIKHLLQQIVDKPAGCARCCGRRHHDLLAFIQ